MEVERVEYRGYEDVALVADVRGRHEDWPVLFLHGGGQTRQAWGGTAQKVADRGWRTITLDLRGHGESQWSPTGDYAYEAYREDLNRVITALGRPPVLVGASLGGIAAMITEGATDESRSSGLVLVDIAPQVSVEGVERVRTFMRSGIDGFDSLDDAARAIAAYTPERKRPTNLAGLAKVLRERDGRYYWHWDPKIITDDRAEERYLGLSDTLDAALSRTHVPIMLVHGLSSDVVTHDGVEELLKKVPHAKVVGISGAAHMIAGDRNDAFTAAVVKFLDDEIRPRLAA